MSINGAEGRTCNGKVVGSTLSIPDSKGSRLTSGEVRLGSALVVGIIPPTIDRKESISISGPEGKSDTGIDVGSPPKIFDNNGFRSKSPPERRDGDAVKGDSLPIRDSNGSTLMRGTVLKRGGVART